MYGCRLPSIRCFLICGCRRKRKWIFQYSKETREIEDSSWIDVECLIYIYMYMKSWTERPPSSTTHIQHSLQSMFANFNDDNIAISEMLQICSLNSVECKVYIPRVRACDVLLLSGCVRKRGSEPTITYRMFAEGLQRWTGFVYTRILLSSDA